MNTLRIATKKVTLKKANENAFVPYINFRKSGIIIALIFGIALFLFGFFWNIFLNVPISINAQPEYGTNKALEKWWFGFFQYWTTQSNCLVFIAEVIALICALTRSKIFKKFTFFTYILAYISLTCIIFTFVLLPAYIQVGGGDMVSNMNIIAFIPQTLAFHILCPIAYFTFCIFLYDENKQIKREIKRGWFYSWGVLYFVAYFGYVIFINFFKIDGGYHTVYAMMTNYNPKCYLDANLSLTHDSLNGTGGNPWMSALLPVILLVFSIILLAYRWISMRVNGMNYNREKKIQKTINWYLKGMYRPSLLANRKELSFKDIENEHTGR